MNQCYIILPLVGARYVLCEQGQESINLIVNAVFQRPILSSSANSLFSLLVMIHLLMHGH
jgi:hypothetical protein